MLKLIRVFRNVTTVIRLDSYVIFGDLTGSYVISLYQESDFGEGKPQV